MDIDKINSDLYYIHAFGKIFRIYIWGNPEDSDNTPVVEIDRPNGNGTYSKIQSINILKNPWYQVLEEIYNECKQKTTNGNFKVEKFDKQLNKEVCIYKANELDFNLFKVIFDDSKQIKDYLANRYKNKLYKEWKWK